MPQARCAAGLAFACGPLPHGLSEHRRQLAPFLICDGLQRFQYFRFGLGGELTQVCELRNDYDES